MTTHTMIVGTPASLPSMACWAQTAAASIDQEHQQREQQHLGVRAGRDDDVLTVVEEVRGDGHA